MNPPPRTTMPSNAQDAPTLNAAEALQTSEIRYRRLFESARDGILILDAITGKITDVNPFMVELLGYSHDEFIGKKLWEIGLLQDTATSITAFKALQAHGHIRYENLPLRTKAGARHDVEFVSNIHDENGHKVVQCNIRDITQRKLIDENSARLAAIVESSEDAIISKTLDGIVMTWNLGAQNLYGYTAAEAVGRPISFIASPELADEMPQLLEKIRHGDPVKHYETVRVRKDGSRVDISLSISPMRDAEGNIIGASSIKRDITQRKRVEEMLRRSEANLATAQQMGRLGSWEWELTPHADWRKNRVHWSDEVFRIFGYVPGEVEASFDIFQQMLPPDDCARIEAVTNQAILDKRGYNLGHRILLLDGTERVVHEQADFVFDGAGIPIRVIGTVQDITDRKLTEATLGRSEARFRTAITEAPVPIMIHREDGEVLQISKGWTEYSGYSLQDIPTINDWAERAYGEKSAEAYEHIKSIYLINRTRSEGEWTVSAKNGQKRIWDFTSTPLGTFGDNQRVIISTAFDVTESKRAAAELHFQQALLKAQTEASLDGILVVSAESEERKILSYNHRLVQMWDIPPDVVAGGDDAAFREVILGQVLNRQAVLEEANYIYNHPAQQSREEISLRNGRIFDRYSAPIADADGSNYGRVWFFRDITDTKQAETLLQDNKQRLALATESAHIGIWDWNVAENKMVWDAQMYALHGIPMQDSRSSYGMWRNGLHPEDWDSSERAIATALDGSEDFHTQFRVVWPNGEVHHLEAHAQVLRADDGTAQRMIGVNWDITEVKQAEAALQRAFDQLEVRVQERTAELERANSKLRENEVKQQQIMDTLSQTEERFRLLVESVHDHAIYMLDTTGHVLTWNAGAAAMKGYRAEDIIGQHFSCFYTEEDRQVGKPDKEIAIAASQGFYDDEGWHVRQDGSRFWATVVITALRDDAGNLRGFVKVSRDITERRNVEAALRDAKAQADTANQAKSEFLSRMSHELRTPLNAILGFGQILKKEDLSPLAIESVSYILKGGRHLLDLINEVLDIARVEAGRIELSLEPVALNDIVPEVCALIRPLAAEHNIRLDDNIAKLERDYIFADRQRLKQVLINFLSNAIKYNREGGQVEVSCEQKTEGRISIAIRDTGVGISPQDMGKLFTPFERLGASSSEIEGTGLGLVLSQRMVSAMGGTLNVTSTLGQGTTFTVELPQASSPEEQLANLVINTHNSNPSKQAQGQLSFSVLCIEDNPSHIRLLELIFQGRPEITLLTAMLGSAGLELARNHEPDLILLDLDLPDINGRDVLVRLQKSALTRDIPVVIISADATKSQVERLLSMGASACLTKPLDVDQFLQTLDRFLLTKDIMVTEALNKQEPT